MAIRKEASGMNRSFAETAPSPSGGRKHTLQLDGREKIQITGVENVDSFEESCVVLQTSEGVLTVDGEDLHIVRLEVEQGELEMEGLVYGLYYTEESLTKPLKGKRKKKS